jgi:hypothetical protein
MRLALPLLLAACQVEKPAPEGPLSGVPASLPPREEGVLLLAVGDVLVWTRDGAIRIGGPEMGWSPERRLPVHYVTTVVPCGEGALLGGSAPDADGVERAFALRLDARGEVVTTWPLGQGTPSSVACESPKPMAASSEGLFLLEEGGRVARLDTVGGRRFVLDGPAPVLCEAALRVMQGGHPASCRDLADRVWSEEGAWTRAPLLCGAWLVEPGERELKVRDARSGRVAGARDVPTLEALACSGEGALLVSAGGILSLELPSLATQARAEGACAALHASHERVVCLDERGGVTWVGGLAPVP